MLFTRWRRVGDEGLSSRKNNISKSLTRQVYLAKRDLRGWKVW